jgi:sortase (surface protein transpeptidase)
VALAALGLAARTSQADPNERAETTRPAVRPPTLAAPGASPAPLAKAHPAELPAITQTARPTRLQLPAAGIDVPVLAVGVANDGQMALPPNPSTIGWYEFGPSPQDSKGSVVLGGHIDSKQYGVGPLARLRKAEPGDAVTVRSSDGSLTTYRVQTVRDIRKSRLALGQVFDRDGKAQLRIITCGGPYDRDGGGYRDNLVVTAVPA